MKKIRKSKCFCIVLCMALLLGIVYNPASAKASDTATETKEVKMEPISNISQYRGATNTAPTMDGYVFSGWRGVSEDGNYYVLEEAQADEAARNGDSVYAKFVPIEVLSCKFQFKGGTTILSEDTTLRLVTSVDSKLYKSVGFKITMENATREVDSRKVYETIGSLTQTYNPDVFSPVSAFFATTLLINIGFHVFENEIIVTPFWVTKDGTKVYGQQNTADIEERLATIDYSENLQANMGTDFEKMGIVEEEASWDGRGYYHNTTTDGGVVAIINDGTNTFARLRPVNKVGNTYYATLTKSCSPEIVSQKCKLQIQLRTGSEANGELQLGIYAKTGETEVTDPETGLPTGEIKETWEWVLPYRSEWAVINTTTYPSGETWYILEKELDLKATALQAVNVDFAYKATSPSADNYVEIDNIKVYNENNVDIDRLAQDGFEGLAKLNLNTQGWYQDLEERKVIYVEDRTKTNSIVVEEKEHFFKFYTEEHEDATINFAGNPEVAKEGGYYKLTARVKLGSGAINVADNIGFRLHWGDSTSTTSMTNLGIGDKSFGGYKRLYSLSSDGEWMTMVAYFQVPEAKTTADAVNIQFWAFTYNQTTKDPDNYVLLDDIQIYKVTPKQ